MTQRQDFTPYPVFVLSGQGIEPTTFGPLVSIANLWVAHTNTGGLIWPCRIIVFNYTCLNVTLTAKNGDRNNDFFPISHVFAMRVNHPWSTQTCHEKKT